MFGVEYSLQHVGRLLNRLGFTFRKPERKDPRKDPALAAEWRETTLPKLLEEAEKQGRKLYYADEASFFVTPKIQRCFLPKDGSFPIEIWSKSFEHMFVCSGISSEGDFTFTTEPKPYTGEKIVEFLEHLLDEEPEPVTLIWDGASIHDCQAVRRFLDSLPKGRLKLVQQPPYSPEVNPDEHVWGYMKGVDLKNLAFKSLEELKDKLLETLNEFKSRKSLILEFFQDENVGFY